MMRKPVYAVRWTRMATVLLALTSSMGMGLGCGAQTAADSRSVDASDGAAAGGACAPADCAPLVVPNDAFRCPDGTSVTRSVCGLGPTGACGWQFPACASPPPTDAAAAPLDASPYCTAQDCAGLTVPADVLSCPDGTNIARSVCEPGSDGACAWEFPPCPGSSLSDAGLADAGDPACSLEADGSCTTHAAGIRCDAFTGHRFDGSRGCYVPVADTLVCCARAPNASCNGPPVTGCVYADRSEGRFVWFLATDFVPSYQTPGYVYAPALLPCDSILRNQVGSSKQCLN